MTRAAVPHTLRTERVREIIDRHHMTLGEVAVLLGVSRSFWSPLINRNRSVSPKMRRRILACEVFAGVPDPDLWQRGEAIP